MIAMQSMNNSDHQRKMQEIQEKYADKPDQQLKEMMKIMKWSNGPLAWCKMMLLQLPLFLALYGVMTSIAGEDWMAMGSSRLAYNLPFNEMVYSFLQPFVWHLFDAGSIHQMFLGIDLFATGSIVIAVATWLAMYLNTRVTNTVRPPVAKSAATLPNGMEMPDMQKMMKPMMYVMPLLMAWVSYSLNAWVWLYVFTTTLVWAIQTLYNQRAIIRAKVNARQAKRKGYGEVIDPTMK